MTNDTEVLPEWQPPTHLADPYVRRHRIRRVDWSRISRGRIQGGTNQAVAWRLSDYANVKGENCHPGARRLGRDVRASEKSVRRALAYLCESGWITLVRHGNRQLAQSDVYCLTLPAPVAAELGRWGGGKDEQQWMERPASAPSGAEAGDARPERCPPIPQPRQRPDRSTVDSTIPDTTAAIPDSLDAIPDTGVQPTGPEHQGLLTSSRYSISAARHVERAIFEATRDLDPDEVDYDDELIAAIEEEIGCVLDAETEQTVRGMAMSQVHRKVIIRKALLMEMGPEAS